MKILDRYVLTTFLKNYLISFVVLVGMYVVMDMVFNFRDLVDVKGSNAANADIGLFGTIANIADYYFYRVFLIFVYLSGIIPVVAAAFTLMRLSRFNELTAVLAAGVPILRIAMPVIIAGMILNSLLIADQELIIPRMIPQLMRDHDEARGVDVKSFAIMAMEDKDGSLLRASKYTPASPAGPATMQIVDVIERQGFESDAPTAGGAGDAARSRSAKPPAIEVKAHISADSATWNAALERWDLVNGRRVTGLGASDTVSAVSPMPFYQSNVTPEEIALYRSGDWVELLSTSKLNELIERPKNYGQAHLLRTKHWRFVQPIMNVILLLLAIPCVMTREPGKLKAAATKCLILVGLAMGSIFLSQQLAGREVRPEWAAQWPAFAAFLPIFVFFPVSMLLLSRVKS